MTLKEFKQKIIQSDPDYLKKNKIFKKIVREIFGKVIYVMPETYTFLLGLNLALSSEQIAKTNEDNLFTVYTRASVNGAIKHLSFMVTPKTGKAIKVVLKDKPQFIFPPKGRLKFDPKLSQLVISDIPVPVKQNSLRFRLCDYMINEKPEMPWTVGELVEVVGNDPDENKDWYSYIYGKLRRLNKDIKDITGYEKFFISENGDFILNPTYQYLLSE